MSFHNSFITISNSNSERSEEFLEEKNSNWKKLLGFRAMQEKLENYIFGEFHKYPAPHYLIKRAPPSFYAFVICNNLL